MAKISQRVEITTTEEDSSDTESQIADQPPEKRAKIFQELNKCIFCDKEFKKKDDYERHIFTHTGEKKFHCHYESCDKEYTNSSHLKRHINSAHEKKPQLGSVKCKSPNCKQLFTNTSNMTRHYNNIHIQGKRYECSECQEKFMRKIQLKKHLFGHSGQYPHRCEICNMGFINLKNYNKHLTAHKSETPKHHECPDCEQKFDKWTTMVAHRKIEHALRFDCDTCQKKFFSKANLKAHKKVHLELRVVFECEIENCPKFYTEKKNLQAHIRSKHEGKKFTCEVEGCGRQLSTKQKLALHHKMHKDSTNKEQTMKKPKQPKKPRAKRFDAGQQKHSTISKLLGISLEPEIDRMLMADRGNEISVDVKLIDSSAAEEETDTDDVKEVRVIWKTAVDSSE